MKKLQLAGNLLKVMLLGGLLVGCQPEDGMSPTPADETFLTDKNAKTAWAVETPKLIQDGSADLEYYTAGRDAGKLWKVTAKHLDPASDYVDEYTYSNLVIVRTRKKLSNGVTIGEVHYYLNYDGLCTSAFIGGKLYDYDYNELKQLIKVSDHANPNEHTDFEYLADVVGNFQSLSKAVLYNSSNIKYKEITYGYVAWGQGLGTVKPDKYRLNLITEKKEIPGVIEMYLPIYGRFNTNLLRQVCVKPFPYNGQPMPALRYDYVMDSNGYASTRARTFLPDGITGQTVVLDYNAYMKYLKPLKRTDGI